MAEVRLLDANALREKAEVIIDENYDDHVVVYAEDIDNAPTIDAVPVVRCKDCIGKAHWYKNDYGFDICGLSGLFVVEDKDFCSYGERREENAVD